MSVLVACGGPSRPGQGPEPPATSPAPQSAASAAPKPPSAPDNRCGALDCRSFDSPLAAFDAVLAEKPIVLGVGEAHALAGTEGIPSTTRRFTEAFLPKLAGNTSDLIVELMLPSAGCEQKKQEVAKRQEVVTKPQAESNQSEYVTLGHSARKHGIAPDILRPSCDDLTRITEAGPGDINVMLETIARLTKSKVEQLISLNEKDHKQAMVVTYGGALHNDVSPREGRETWSYGPALSERTHGRYVELDLIVPEFIKDTDSWRALSWYTHYDRDKLGDKTVLFKVAAHSYVLVFPLTKGAASE